MPRISSPWLVTGAAGFIGSHVVERLLKMRESIRIVDNFSTGKRANLFPGTELLQGDISDPGVCQTAMRGVKGVIHLAALGSVPKSLETPALCHASNETGAFNIFEAAVRAGVKRVVYASSSAVYGDDARPRKREDCIGHCLSPYAASKRINEIHAQTWRQCYGLETVGLRFFNVFGPRQDPNGAYAAVIPQWIAAMRDGRDVFINGDGKNSRDFCYVGDVAQALVLAATTKNNAAFGEVFNVGLGKSTSLNELFHILADLVEKETGSRVPPAIYRDFRAGDIRHSCADTTKIQELLRFDPQHQVKDGLRDTVRAMLQENTRPMVFPTGGRRTRKAA
jgi:UDP-N-acetylglucosamine 4-epimerase